MTQQLRTEPRPKQPPASAGRAITYREFLNWDGENQHVEWVNGEVVPMPPISSEHNAVGNFLLHLFQHYLDAHDLGVVRSDPFQMKTGPKLPGRAPDILFAAKKNLARLKKNHLEGPADLVVEVISPGSRGVDRGDRFYEYEQGGVKEYWLIDPPRKQAEFYGLGRDGIYRLLPADDGVFRSAVLKGLWIETRWLWQDPLPPLVKILKKWKLV